LHAIHVRTDLEAYRRRLPWHPVELQAVIGAWWQRHRYRRELRRLMSSGPHLIADIGLSRTHAEREAAKPFWRP
jgi:uncharacterized protein YjiS (DUF1127 family)